MNFTRKVKNHDGPLLHAVVKMTAVQGYDQVPTTVFTEIVGDGRMLLRNRVLYCDFRASDALLRDLGIVLQVFTRALPMPEKITLVIGNVAAFSYLTRQAPPPTNTTHTLYKQAHATMRNVLASIKLQLSPKEQVFQEYGKFVYEQYEKSDRTHPTFVETGIGEIEYTYDDVREQTGQ